MIADPYFLIKFTPTYLFKKQYIHNNWKPFMCNLLNVSLSIVRIYKNVSAVKIIEKIGAGAKLISPRPRIN